MILVSVREHDGGQIVTVLFEEIEVGHGHVHAVGRLFWKAHPCVHDDHLVAVAHRHAVHPELADPAERDYLDHITHSRLIISPVQASAAHHRSKR